MDAQAPATVIVAPLSNPDLLRVLDASAHSTHANGALHCAQSSKFAFVSVKCMEGADTRSPEMAGQDDEVTPQWFTSVSHLLRFLLQASNTRIPKSTCVTLPQIKPRRQSRQALESIISLDLFSDGIRSVF